jgi:hypothetical protein
MSLYSGSQFYDALKRWLVGAGPEIGSAMDPIDHPAIAVMSLIELADLPLRGDPADRKCVDAGAGTSSRPGDK